MKISVIGPMRGRFDGAKRGIDSLINQAHNIDDVEFIFRFDDDDMDTVDKLREYYVDKNIDITFLVGERFGYCNMHKYWNQCTMESKGEYLMTWTDDNEMDIFNKGGWDSLIQKFEGQFYILDFPDNTDTKPYKNWPSCVVFPRKIFEILGGRLAPNLIFDKWMIEILKVNDIWIRFDEKIMHHQVFSGRASLDDNYREGRGAYNTMSKSSIEGWVNFDPNDSLKIKEYLNGNPNTKEIKETDKYYFGRAEKLNP